MKEENNTKTGKDQQSESGSKGMKKTIKKSLIVSLPSDDERRDKAYRSGVNLVIASKYQLDGIMFILKSKFDHLDTTLVYELLDKTYNVSPPSLRSVSDVDTIRLARDLGFLSSTRASVLLRAEALLRYTQFLEMRRDSYALRVKKGIKPAISVQDARRIDKIYESFSSLGGSKNSRLVKSLRNRLTSERVEEEYLIDIQKKYTFKRTALRLILGMVRTTYGKVLNNILSNSQVIIPSIWDGISGPDKFQVGRCYADLVFEGRTTAADGLRRVLFKVHGFDYVPDDSRFSIYSSVADEIIDAHFSRDSYYAENKPVKALLQLGSSIPKSVFSKCLTSVLFVELGGEMGTSPETKQSADAILETIPLDRWVYFFNECFPYEDRLLFKLTQKKTVDSWMILKETIQYDRFIDRIINPGIRSLLETQKAEEVSTNAEMIYHALGN